MDCRPTSIKKASSAKEKPIIRKNAFSLGLSTSRNPPIVVPFSKSSTATHAQYNLARNLKKSKLHPDLVKKAAHIEALRKKISDLFRRATDASLICGTGANSKLNATATHQASDETYDLHLARLISRLMKTQSEGSFQSFIQRILVEIDSLMMEYIDEQLRNSREHNEHQIEDLILLFEQSIRQKECSYQREIQELYGRIDYIQDQLRATRMSNEILEQQLANANSVLLGRSQDMGHNMEEIVQLRHEVEELRSYKRKHECEMRNIHQLYRELDINKAINQKIVEEFVKIENERDELRSTFTDSLVKIRRSNQRRREAIETELKDIEELLDF